jgi:hypothetical protein
VFFSRPVTGVTAATFTVTDAAGTVLPAWVDPIGDGVWGLFANQIQYKPGATYTAHLAAGICDAMAPSNCTATGSEWSFTIAADAESADGDSGVPMGFAGANGASPSRPAAPAASAPAPAAPTPAGGAPPAPVSPKAPDPAPHVLNKAAPAPGAPLKAPPTKAAPSPSPAPKK